MFSTLSIIIIIIHGHYNDIDSSNWFRFLLSCSYSSFFVRKKPYLHNAMLQIKNPWKDVSTFKTIKGFDAQEPRYQEEKNKKQY